MSHNVIRKQHIQISISFLFTTFRDFSFKHSLFLVQLFVFKFKKIMYAQFREAKIIYLLNPSERFARIIQFLKHRFNLV